jgi:uncharacterized Zn finger protein
MSRYYGGWAPYVSVAERRSQAAREVAKLRKQGRSIAPVIVSGRTIASTFWGKSWCENLESYRDVEYRLERGRSYVRNGLVLDLQVAPLQIRALVSGSSIYEVEVSIAALPKGHWQSICRDCAGGIDSLVELLRGRFSKPVMERLCRQEMGLFPRPSQIKFSCSCLDHASMCKHVAAALYAVAARLDEKPELLFLLRAVDENDLLTGLDDGLKLSKMPPSTGKILEGDDLSALFGLDMGSGDMPQATAAEGQKKPSSRTASVDQKPLKPVGVIAKIPQLRKTAQLTPEPVEIHRPPPKKPTKTHVKHNAKRSKTGKTKL